MSTSTHSIKETTELPCLGILKHGNYDLTIRWMYVMSTVTPTTVRAKPSGLGLRPGERHVEHYGVRERELQ